MRAFGLVVSATFALTLAGCGSLPAQTSTKAIVTQTLSQNQAQDQLVAQAARRDLARFVKAGFKIAHQHLDKNQDGVLTREEVGSQGEFDKLDRNGDGVVTLDEIATDATVEKFVDSIKDTSAKLVVSLDTNGDKRVTVTELRPLGLSDGTQVIANPEPIKRDAFRLADKNGDNTLTRAELDTWFGILFGRGFGWGAPISR